MGIETRFENDFKPEVRSSGQKLFAQEKVTLSNGSDTGVQAYVRSTPSFKVRFSSETIASEQFNADCSCPASKKGQFCKHIWAVLLCAQEKYPDFFSAKSVINQVSAAPETVAETQPTLKTERETARAELRSAYQASAKVRAAEYRKEQYQRMKARAKEHKRGSADAAGTPSKLRSVFTPELEAALKYFSENGFPMASGPAEDILLEAKRKLSRVFHPDKGGSTEEMVELNRHCEVVEQFL
jgi:uncharacterized Zn finger protein